MRPPRAGRRAGFTLMELLITMVVLGVLAALLTSNLLSGRDARLLREGQSELAQALEQARTLSRRYSRDYWFELQSGGLGYRLTPRDGANTVVPGLPAPQGTIDSGVKASLDRAPQAATPARVTFAGPYGRLLADRSSATGRPVPACFVLTLASSPNGLRSQINLVGLTGKVVSRGVSASSSC